MFVHQDVTDGCDTVREVYKAWGDRGRQLAKGRQKLEGWGSFLLFLSAAFLITDFSNRDSTYITEASFVGVALGLSLLWSALRHWIEEMHVDYLLHKLDLEMAIARIKDEERRYG